jgi:hypothetical protein
VSDGTEDLMAHRRVIGCDQAKQGHQDQQKWEQGSEPCVGQVSHQHPTVVVSVLLDQRDNKCRHFVFVAARRRSGEPSSRPGSSAATTCRAPVHPGCPPEPPAYTSHAAAEGLT